MSDSFVTQCPHCQTSFRVSHNQLSVARGVVRCGACLQVFNAARQLLEQSAARSGTPLPPSEPALPVATSQAEWHELDAFEQNLAPRSDNLSASRDDPHPDEDHPWTGTLFGAQDDEHGRDHDDDTGEPPLIERDPPLSEASPEPRYERLSATPADEPPAAVTAVATRSKERERTEPALHDHLDLSEDPLQLSWEKAPPAPWGRKLAWAAATLAAALLLGGQYVAYHFEEMARQDDYRPWFQRLCPMLGCEVPSKVDIALIKSSNLVVRSHPDFAGALVVDAIIYNRAAFSQPFPLLELRFADLNGALIASRRFKPSEYLGGDLAGQSDMPPQTPIHIALDILDPGTKAVNYSLSFRSPE